MPRILIIDDEEQFRTMLRITLEQAGYETIAAADGREGLAAVMVSSPVDLVVTDLIVPGKEGLETIPELRREFPALKIVAISGGGRADPKSYLKSAEFMGADCSFEKPLDMKKFLVALEDLLGERNEPEG